jgi:ectoine hydroxylase-related dioxygenase (phytanoyl-CoA dioxygenase family)
MTTINTPILNDQQIADFHENGYAIVRNVLSPEEVDKFRPIVQEQAQCNSYPASLKYPEPGKYTIAGNKMAESSLASIAEHPTVVNAVECALGQPAHLTAFVAYLRSPGDRGSGGHCDYKRWRPVGSSMNWVFAIIPLTDFDEVYGPFMVSPGSHKLPQVIDEEAHILDLTRPDTKQLAPFIDPELKAGDLLITNQHTWHRAPAGTATDDRCGIFHKYCAVNAPPSAGYYPYNPAALSALSDAGKRLIPVCFDKPITMARLLIECPSNDESKYLLQRDDENDRWELPGGEGWEEEGVGWDIGARIASLQDLTKTQLELEVPWMSYIEDVEQKDGICRVYGYSDESLALTNDRCDWFTKERVRQMLGDSDYICHAIHTWHQGDIIRGKGKACRQSKEQFD